MWLTEGELMAAKWRSWRCIVCEWRRIFRSVCIWEKLRRQQHWSSKSGRSISSELIWRMFVIIRRSDLCLSSEVLAVNLAPWQRQIVNILCCFASKLRGLWISLECCPFHATFLCFSLLSTRNLHSLPVQKSVRSCTQSSSPHAGRARPLLCPSWMGFMWRLIRGLWEVWCETKPLSETDES